MRIFVNNVDGYVGRALCADLRSVLGQENRLLGTVSVEGDEAGTKLAPSLGVKRVVARSSEKQLLKDVLTCTLIVYDLHSADLDEVERVIKHLKVATLEHDTTFVLISSVNVWAKTKKEYVPLKGEEEEEDDEEGDEDQEGLPREVKKRPKELGDADLDRRVPSRSHESWKYLETLTLSLSSRAKLRPHVIAAGVLYGNGESVFNELFKAAWLTQPAHRIIQPGGNYIPCVHVRDVARLVKVVAAESGLGRYLVAVDKSRLTQTDIVQGIVDQISNKKEVPVVSEGEVDNEFKEIMMLDLIMEPSAPMRSKSFQWWCRDGLIKDMGKVAAEFCKWRNLRPIKMVVTGPPGSGAERYCARVAGRYLHEDPPHFSFDKILQDAMKEPGAAAAKLRRKVDKISKVPGAKLPLKIRTKLVRARLMSNVCRYRGYVLEGYPTSYEEASDLFTELEVAEGEEAPAEEEEEEGEEDDEEEPVPPAKEQQAEEDDDEDEENPKPQRRLNGAISPEFVVTLRSTEDRCKRRLFAGEASGPTSEEDFLQRTAEYRRANLAEDGSPGTSDFFSEVAGLRVLHVDADACTEEEALQSICVYLESSGPLFNYLRSEEELAREREAELARREREEDERRAEEARAWDAAEAKLREKALGEEAHRRQVIAESEATLLENEALPLKQYLMSYVVPTLSEGLTQVCKEQPEDPIEFLAQYLFAHAQDIEGPLADEHH